MFGFLEIGVLCVFLFFYVGLFYNLPVLAAGVWDVLRGRRFSKVRVLGRDRGVLPFFSLLVPVKNEERVVGRLLECLSHLDYPRDRFEVVVVDDGSSDGTADICRRFVGAVNLQFLQREVSRGKANALNFGLKHCHGEIVGVFDADNVVAKDALHRVAAYFEDERISAVQGRIHSINSHENMLTQFIACEDAVWGEAFLRGKDALGLFVCLRGCCEFVRRGVLNELGGFEDGAIAEDVEISARLTEQGYGIRYASDVKVWQENPARLRSYLRQRVRWCRGHLDVAFRYGRLLSRVNRRTVDAEVTLFLPLVAIASMVSYWFASWAVLYGVELDVVLGMFSIFSTVCTSVLIVLAGLAMIYVTKPLRVRSLLWLPFVFGYWVLETFLACYAVLLIVLRRPRRWVKTEKSGAVASPEFSLEAAREHG